MKSPVTLAALASASVAAAQTDISVSNTAPSGLNQPAPDAFVSYSIEFAYFPDYAGNNSHPNTFSANLLTNIGNIIGTKPYIRVGGNTQDYALYNASLTYAVNGTINPARSADYPTTVYIGPSYFESYNTLDGVRFSHGFNLALGANSTAGWETLLDTVPLACAALGNGKLYWWEYGNEPDLYSTSAQGPVRPSTWNESTYVSQWLNGTREILALIKKNCPDLVGDSYGYIAPSFAGTGNHLRAPTAWADGLDVDDDIKLFSSHNYISGATSPGVTLQGTLMNHTITVNSIEAHVTEYNKIAATDANMPPHIFGECNSLYNEGKPGLSNSFGAALWGVDFNLYSASAGFKRVHMHMGTNYRYAFWQPVETNITTIGTKAPYYGNIAVASFLGDTTAALPSVQAVSNDDRLPAYAAYVNGTLARLAVINLNAYNTTVDGAGESPLANPGTRPNATVAFTVTGTAATKVLVQRLWANGSDAISGITFDGWSYNYELDNGKPVRLSNVTIGETVAVTNGSFEVEVPDSSAVVLTLQTGSKRCS